MNTGSVFDMNTSGREITQLLLFCTVGAFKIAGAKGSFTVPQPLCLLSEFTDIAAIYFSTGLTKKHSSSRWRQEDEEEQMN